MSFNTKPTSSKWPTFVLFSGTNPSIFEVAYGFCKVLTSPLPLDAEFRQCWVGLHVFEVQSDIHPEQWIGRLCRYCRRHYSDKVIKGICSDKLAKYAPNLLVEQERNIIGFVQFSRELTKAEARSIDPNCERQPHFDEHRFLVHRRLQIHPHEYVSGKLRRYGFHYCADNRLNRKLWQTQRYHKDRWHRSFENNAKLQKYINQNKAREVEHQKLVQENAELRTKLSNLRMTHAQNAAAVTDNVALMQEEISWYQREMVSLRAQIQSLNNVNNV